MKIYLAGCSSFMDVVEGALKGDFSKYIPNSKNKYTAENFYLLESFFYTKKDAKITKLLPYFKGFLLDSGAFTFRQATTKADWNSYLDDYADFINHHDVKLFFELDIDSEIGYNNVLKLRDRLEGLTNKKCIPVWHPNRGKQEFIKMCKEYPYVSLGGLVGSKSKGSNYIKYFPWFIQTAHYYGAQIHGLGYTHMSDLHRCHFDSVDSTSWTSGGRFGHIFKFNGNTLVKFDKPAGHRVKTRETCVNNFCEWTKFANWAETHL